MFIVAGVILINHLDLAERAPIPVPLTRCLAERFTQPHGGRKPEGRRRSRRFCFRWRGTGEHGTGSCNTRAQSCRPGRARPQRGARRLPPARRSGWRHSHRSGGRWCSKAVPATCLPASPTLQRPLCTSSRALAPARSGWKLSLHVRINIINSIN